RNQELAALEKTTSSPSTSIYIMLPLCPPCACLPKIWEYIVRCTPFSAAQILAVVLNASSVLTSSVGAVCRKSFSQDTIVVNRAAPRRLYLISLFISLKS